MDIRRFSDKREFRFEDQLRMSRGIAVNTSIADILLTLIPGATRVDDAHLSDDRNGTDKWVVLKCGKRVSVDVKARDEDWSKKGADDLALETYSVVERDVPGWTRDQDKHTDYILWYWEDTGRYVLVPFSLLCKAFQEKWESWRRTYKRAVQSTTDLKIPYHSECVFVPRIVVWRAVYEVAHGFSR